MNYVELHLGDWAGAVAHLSLVEEAVYLRLLRRYYTDEKPLPADVAACQRLAGARTDDERQAVIEVLREFFVLADDGHRNKRADAEIAKVYAKKGKAAASAKARWDAVASSKAMQSDANASTSDADAMRSHSEGNALQSPDTKQDQELSSPDKPETAKPTPIDSRIAEITDEAIEAYNRVCAEPLSLPRAMPVGIAKKRGYVRRSLQTIREVCRVAYGSERITAQFWADYFGTQAADDFIAGRTPRGKGHENWRPDFEFLTRPDVIAKAFERAAA